MGKYTAPAPDYRTYLDCMQAIHEDCACDAQVRIIAADNEYTRVKVIVETYRTVNGVKIGIGRFQRIFPSVDHKGIEGCIQLLLHHAYHHAYDLAHSGGKPHLGNMASSRPA